MLFLLLGESAPNLVILKFDALSPSRKRVLSYKSAVTGKRVLSYTSAVTGTVRSTKRLPIGWPVLTTQFNIKTTLQFNVIPATEVWPLWLALLPDKLVMTGNQGWNIISDCH